MHGDDARAPAGRATKGTHALRRNYAVAGIVVAVLVATLIVVAGSRSPGNGSSSADHETSASALPTDHPSTGSSTGSLTDYGAMVKLLEARYAKHPSDTKTAMNLADAYLMTEQPTKAQRLYTKVLASDPSNETAKVQLAMALHADGRDEQALALLRGVLQTDPRSQLAHYNLAILYFSEQKSAEARDEWKEAAAIDPTSGIGESAQNFVNLMAGSTGGPHPSGAKGD
jgi:tetratricopeptide (TPR) repeat protein